MRFTIVLLLLASQVFQTSCEKNHDAVITPPPQPPTEKKILLKDIVIPHLPSPYYHFEYNEDSLVEKADFASGYNMYDVFRLGNRITEMRNNIVFNHDTLRYFYNSGGKLSLIKFINEKNVNYRQAKFIYDGEQVEDIEWDELSSAGDFVIDRRVSFTFFADGNLKSIDDHRFPHSGAPETYTITTFEGYDHKINVDDFSLVHDGINDHLFLLQGIRLQKNNPTKEILIANGVQRYIIDYTYNYNADATPSLKRGSLLYTSGADSGKIVNIQTQFSYY